MDLMHNFENIKIGDRLQVRPDLHCDLDVPCGVADEMTVLAGDEVTVSNIIGRYRIKITEDDGEFTWSPQMFMTPLPRIPLSEFLLINTGGEV